ncbi:type 4b pilus protein PilO2 [Bordetella sp. FB-8]|uniref:type 4b pilus protein PilO2 n=1 Tax=Bordetella sp. FB-8 TaxID=1159870 RepID=UPI00037584F7|nr:type 4b pilus protein PilO2 [Bordetella sp. FB-8]
MKRIIKQVSSHTCILRHEDSEPSLVFGLTWFALVGSHVGAMARARARQLNATHYVAGGLRAAAGGCVRLARGMRRGQLHAAAQAYAQLHADGPVCSVLALPDGRHWLVAAQDGAVMSRGDHLYASREAAQQAMHALQAQRPALRLVDDAALLERMLQTLDAQSRLLPVDTRWGGLPWPVRACILGAALSLLVPQAWERWRAYRAPMSSAPDPAAARQAALDAWRDSVRIHTPEDLRRLTESLHRIPLALRGWALQHIACEPRSQDWQCTAHYARTQSQATFESFAAAAPQGLKAEFDALDRSILRWRVQGASTTLAKVALPRRPPQAFLGNLQRIYPAFSEVRLGLPVEPAVAADRTRPGAIKSGLPGLRTRALSVSGPLRSFGVLALHSTVASWSSFTLRLDAGRPSVLAGSVLLAQLQGTVYELH